MVVRSPTPPNWFQFARANFETYLDGYRGQPGVRALQIGAYTGDASVWLVDNILTGHGAHLTDVDTWEGSAGESVHEQLDWDAVWATYRVRLAGRPVTPIRMTSDQFFDFFRPVRVFDIIYVDGDHTRGQVARDAGNAHLALKPGGTLIFDDFEWRGHPPGDDPRDAIVPFYEAHRAEYTVVAVNSQLWLRKTDRP